MMTQMFGLVKTALLDTTQQTMDIPVSNNHHVTPTTLTQDMLVTVMNANNALKDGWSMTKETDATDQDSHVDVPKDSMMTITFGHVNNVHLDTTNQIQIQPNVLQSHHAQIIILTQETLVTAMHAITAQMDQDGSLILTETDVTDQDLHVDVLHHLTQILGNVNTAQMVTTQTTKVTLVLQSHNVTPTTLTQDTQVTVSNAKHAHKDG
jgi:hypothetical protein